MRLWLFGVILLLAFLLRVIGIANYPVGFTPDEASFGYDAYSLLATGKDQWGEAFPLALRSFGDFKLPLYAYLTIPSVAIFGLSEFAIRLPNVVLGALGALGVYLMVSELWGGQKGGKSLIIFAAFLLAISPWHISLSRGAFEANLTTFFLPLGVWLFSKGLKNPKLMFLGVLVFGINMLTYHSARVFISLIVGVLVLLNFQEVIRSGAWLKRYRSSAVLLLVIFLGTAYLMFGQGSARSQDVAIYNPTGGWGAVSERRYEAVLAGLPDILARIFSNKVFYTTSQFLTNYFSYLSPQFLFTNGAGEWTYGMIPGQGVLYLVEMVFVLWGLFSFAKKPSKEMKFILLWILLAPIPAALAKGPGFAANRAAVMMPAIQILSAYGLVGLSDRLGKVRVLRGRALLGIIVILLGSLLFFLEDYFYHAPRHGAASMLYGRKEAVEGAKSVENQYDQIIFSRSLSEPHIYVAFYNKWDPLDYQKSSTDWKRYEQEGRSFLDQLGKYSLGKYEFTDIDFANRGLGEKVLLVGKPQEFPKDIKAIKTVYFPDGQKAILLVDPAQNAQTD